MSLVDGTLINTPDGQKPIEQTLRGRMALGGSVTTGSIIQLNWNPTIVVDNIKLPTTEVVVIRADGDRQLICTLDQTLLCPDGTLLRAEQVLLGPHQLVDSNGNAVAINYAARGLYSGAAHRIYLFGDSNSNSFDGHLICANDLVVGDATLRAPADRIDPSTI